MGKPRKQFLHSTYWCDKHKKTDAIVACIKDLDTNECELKTFVNPSRSIWVTKPALRTHTHKKTCEHTRNLDHYVVPNMHVADKLSQVLNNGYGSKWIRHLLDSPYVYGCDIDIETLAKISYFTKYNAIASSYRVGALDIETSLLGGEEILLCTYTSPEGQSYTAMLSAFVEGFTDEAIHKQIQVRLKELVSKLNKKTLEIANNLDLFNVTITRCETEVDLITWIMKMIHKDKPEFVSIWNINFDIKYILKRLKLHNASLEDIFCHPDVPKKYRVCKYKEDKGKVQHYTHRWHMFNVSGYTQFYDSMNLFSRLRKFAGVRNSYKLEVVGAEFTGAGKAEIGTHRVMQATQQVDYVAYNVVDTVLTMLIEKRLNDVGSMLSLILDTLISGFSSMAVQLRNWLFVYLKTKNMVPTAVSNSLEQETDARIINVGGNVLDPELAWRANVVRLQQLMGRVTDIGSKLTRMSSDIDVKSMYPNIMAACGYDKDTKIATILDIDGIPKEELVNFIGHLTVPEENAVKLCSDYLNLPNYKEMDELFDRHIA